MLTRFVRNQLIIFTIASIVGVTVMLFVYMQVPTLLGVGTRRPLMHDGCASTLEERFGLCGGVGDKHGVISHLDDTQRADLVEFMKSL